MLDRIESLCADDSLSFLARPINSRYWRPGFDWLNDTINRIKGNLCSGDFLVISEKAISIAKGNIVDENLIRPGFFAKLLVIGFMRIIWGRILGWLCHLSNENILRLRNYPLQMGAAHKQLALNHVGFFQAIRHGSEGGIDTSNLPFSLVALPLPHPDKESKRIQQQILKITGIFSNVLIVDSDKTYSLNNFHMSVRATKIKGIICLGFIAYFFGRLLKLRTRSTPLGIAGNSLNIEEALRISAIANKVRGSGSGKTAWDMGKTFHTEPHKVTWEMLEKVHHTPIVIVRRISPNNRKSN